MNKVRLSYHRENGLLAGLSFGYVNGKKSHIGDVDRSAEFVKLTGNLIGFTALEGQLTDADHEGLIVIQSLRIVVDKDNCEYAVGVEYFDDTPFRDLKPPTTLLQTTMGGYDAY